VIRTLLIVGMKQCRHSFPVLETGEQAMAVLNCTSLVDWPKLLPNPPLLTSFQSGWTSIQLAHYCQPSIDLPEISNPRHMVIIALGHQALDLEFVSEGRLQAISYREKDFASSCIEVIPADLPCGVYSISAVHPIEWIQCYLESTFLAQIAYESVNPDRIELLLTRKKPDLLIQQIGLALRASLEEDGARSRFYADSMATALSAHLLRYYSTRKHLFREHEDGLSKQKLRQTIEYIQAHLGEDLSLNDIANELGMSQYYFCHLFKRSTGISPHQFLIRQRVEQAKHLLKQPERTILSVAMECGFANQSHLAKCFRQYTGINPNQFRKL
jgi:AraC family transcriptional regulator